MREITPNCTECSKFASRDTALCQPIMAPGADEEIDEIVVCESCLNKGFMISIEIKKV